MEKGKLSWTGEHQRLNRKRSGSDEGEEIVHSLCPTSGLKKSYSQTTLPEGRLIPFDFSKREIMQSGRRAMNSFTKGVKRKKKPLNQWGGYWRFGDRTRRARGIFKRIEENRNKWGTEWLGGTVKNALLKARGLGVGPICVVLEERKKKKKNKTYQKNKKNSEKNNREKGEGASSGP